jgi:hypothetical protein
MTPWDLINRGCELARPNPIILLGIYEMSGGNPCRECNCKQRCSAWREISATALRAPIRDNQQRCAKCNSLLNPVKVQRRGGKCACGHPAIGA